MGDLLKCLTRLRLRHTIECRGGWTIKKVPRQSYTIFSSTLRMWFYLIKHFLHFKQSLSLVVSARQPSTSSNQSIACFVFREIAAACLIFRIKYCRTINLSTTWHGYYLGFWLHLINALDTFNGYKLQLLLSTCRRFLQISICLSGDNNQTSYLFWIIKVSGSGKNLKDLLFPRGLWGKQIHVTQLAILKTQCIAA